MDNEWDKRLRGFLLRTRRPTNRREVARLIHECLCAHAAFRDEPTTRMAVETIVAAFRFHGLVLKRKSDSATPSLAAKAGSGPVGSEVRVIPGDRLPGEDERMAELRHRYAPVGWRPPMKMQRPPRRPR